MSAELAASVVATCCHCPHTSRVHDSDGPCLADNCDCTGMDIEETALVIEPGLPPTPLRRAEPEIAQRGERVPALEAILHAGKQSEYGRTVKLTEKIAVLINDLRGRLADEREAAEVKRQQDAAKDQAKAKIAELERQLAAARAELRGSPSPFSPAESKAISGVDVPCTETGCDRSFVSPQARAMHVRRAHRGFDPLAAKRVAS